MDRSLILTAPSEPGLRLRAAARGDLELLRVLKNANKPAFFFKDEITPEMQAKWYEAYRARPKDFMFVVERGGKAAGVMGFRIQGGGDADTYNMIAVPEAKGTGVMKRAMILMCSYIAANFTKDVGCLVVEGNPAVKYYEHCGYKNVGNGNGHVILKVDWNKLKPISVVATE